jgi:hypothetical protein
MSLVSVVQEAIEKSAKRTVPVLVTEGVVTSVNKETNTCNVDRDNLPELFDVRLNAVISPGDNVVTVYPSKGSKVLVLLVENNNTDGYVLSTTDVDEIIINGGNNGGIAISQKVIDELTEIKDDLNSLKNVFSSWVTAPQDGGAALKLAAASWYGSTLNAPDPSVLINTKIKH